MSVIDEVRSEREDLARVLKKHTGIRRIVEDLYPDSAHFIYELLQNAEDAGANEAIFKLSNASLVFEHDGRYFEPRDIYAITDIGEGTKADDDDKIGRFGVGFKAVFAYSETPHIWSPTFSFKITELVLPTELNSIQSIGNRTRFEFPFNNPKKTAKAAFDEVHEGLSELAEKSLLFLSHLMSVNWKANNGLSGRIAREQHSENHFEILKKTNGKTTSSSHFLRFDRPVEGLEQQRVAIAFELDFLPNIKAFDPRKPLAKQMKIISAAPGRVAVFFPAYKESSGFRFHVHAPFVPELSRASIKDTPANLPLFEQLASLAADSLHQVRDLSLLTAEFLEVLPNSRDQIDERYDVIRSAIIEEMNNEPLTPTQTRSHAPARHLVQGKASLKSLLTDEDIEFLLDYDDEPWRWAVGIPQKNSDADRFMESLSIGKWDVDNFVELLENLTVSQTPYRTPGNISPEKFMEWLRTKSVEWHQEMYALLFTDYLLPTPYMRDLFVAKLKDFNIVRLTNGTHMTSSESFFVTEGFEHKEVQGRVDERVYTSGKSKAQKENARAFLEEIGVRKFGDAEVVELILKCRYSQEAEIPDEKTYKMDLERFIDLVESKPETASLFAKSFIFECGDDWRTPDGVFLDQPFKDTGLIAYYAALGDQADRFALNETYLNCGISVKRLVKFAQTVGAASSLEIQQITCQSNPDVQELVWRAPGKWTHLGINEDYSISRLETLLQTPNTALSQLIWRTLCDQGQQSWTTARFRNNSSYPTRTAPSQIVCILRSHAWVPQTDGRFVRPSEATSDGLPAGFAFDLGWKWLGAIQFGQQLVKKSVEQLKTRLLLKQIGFNDEETLERAKCFAAIPVDEQQRFLANRERQTPIELPEHEPANPSRRAEKVVAQAADAPERLTQERTRSVSVGLNEIKLEAGQYLRSQYTNLDNQMVCQICKNRLPFKLDDGSDYFERVEFLRDLKRRHQQNYLALCPNHSAMFQLANGSTDDLRELVVELAGNEMQVVLAKEDATIYFTKTHLADLKAIILADVSEFETTDNETSDTSDPSSPAEQKNRI